MAILGAAAVKRGVALRAMAAVEETTKEAVTLGAEAAPAAAGSNTSHRTRSAHHCLLGWAQFPQIIMPS